MLYKITLHTKGFRTVAEAWAASEAELYSLIEASFPGATHVNSTLCDSASRLDEYQLARVSRTEGYAVFVRRDHTCAENKFQDTDHADGVYFVQIGNRRGILGMPLDACFVVNHLGELVNNAQALITQALARETAACE